MDASNIYYNPFEETEMWENRLPHWQQPGKTYFVTFRLADSLPAHLLEQHSREKKTWLETNPKPWTPDKEREYHLRFTTKIDHWLDQGYGSCALADGRHARVVADTLAHFEGTRCRQFAWVVMPNHVHAVFLLLEGEELTDLIRSWKRYSARRINETRGKRSPFWQKDYFDRLVRDREHFGNTVRYIRRNPVKACLPPDRFPLFESEEALRF